MRRHARRPRALLGVVTAVVVLLGAEVGLGLSGVGTAYNVDDIGSWRFVANLRDSESRGPRDQHSFRVTTNGDGLRTSLAVARSPGTRRVAIMGDSTVFGWGVDDGGSVADGATAALPPSIEVLNAGQPGYSSTMAAWLFDEVVAAYQPDVTVLFVPMHDTNLVLVSDREAMEGGGGGPAAGLRVFLARNSHIYALLRGWIFDGTDRPWLMPDQASGEPRVPRVSDAERTKALAGMAARAAGWAGTVWVGYLPFKPDIEGPGGERPTAAWANTWSAEHHAPVADLRGCCVGQAGLVLADQPGHLTREGNAAAGRALAALLVAQLPGAQ